MEWETCAMGAAHFADVFGVEKEKMALIQDTILLSMLGFAHEGMTR